MFGKVYNVRWARSARIDSHGCEIWGSYQSCVYVDLWKPKFANSFRSVDITQDVLDYFRGNKITNNRVQQVKEALENEFIEYHYDEDDDEYYMDDNLSDFM